ncbi:MAG TPA: DUF6220 domain-containing protein [Ktedonobacteraceae bacterium]
MATLQVTTARPGSFVRAMRGAYIGVSWLFALCLLVQFFLAGLGVFAGPEWFGVHAIFAFFFEFLTIIMLALALLGRFPRSIPLFSLLLIGQFFLQYTFIELGRSLNVIFIAAFHPVNAAIMLWVTIYVARRAMAIVAASKKQD